MIRPPSVIHAVAADPLWLAHRFDPVADAVHFRRVSRDGHRAATFLTDEELGAADPTVLPRAEATAGAQGGPIHFIFHSAFCCSTLLARAFDIEGVAMGLKEPVILNDLVGWRHRGGGGAAMAGVLDDVLTLLARPFAPGEAVVVKPSNVVNGLAPVMLAMRPGSRALLLHAPLRTYIASIARKGLWGRLWVRDLLIKQLRENFIDLGFDPQDHLGQTDLQVAAVGWLAQQAAFVKLIERFGAERVRSLHSERLVAEPGRTMLALGRLFDLPIDGASAGEIANGPIFTRHSKFGGAFGASERAAEYRSGADAHEDEIGKVLTWAEAVATSAGIPLQLPAPLLD
jgi:hypothetical protein